MACSFTLLRFIIAALLYSSLDWKCLADKEFLFEKGNLWTKKKKVESVGGSGIGWYTIPGEGTAHSCDIPFEPNDENNEEIQNWFYLKKMDTKANRIFVEIDYKITKKSCNASDCGLFLQAYQDSVNFSSDNIPRASFTPKEISTSKVPRTVTGTFFDMKSGSNYIIFAVQAKGVCTVVYNMSIYYYYCPRNTTTSVVLERTPAPSEGSKPVTGYCSKHSVNSPSPMIAYCDQKGNWVNFKPQPDLCRCPVGTEFNKAVAQCTACKVDYFKTSDEDGPCRACPKNSVTNGMAGSTACTCLKDHYRRSVEEKCKKLPPPPNNLKYTILNNNQMLLHWDMPDGYPNVRFNVKCRQRDLDPNKLVPCQYMSIKREGANITTRNLTVDGLLVNEDYIFVVASLNDVSNRVDEAHWETALIEVKLPGRSDPTPNTLPTTANPSSNVVNPIGTTTSRSNTNGGDVVSTVDTNGASEKREDDPTSTSSLGPMIGGAIGGLLLILLIVIVIVYRSKKTKKEKLIEDNMDMSTVDRSYIDPAKYGNPEKAVRVFAKEIDRRQVKLGDVIGEGEFAKVHRGSLCRPNEPAIEVAVKVLKPGSTAKNREDFLTEAAVMGQFKNLNIVALEGVVTISHPVMIITEFMHNGALSKFLAEKKGQLGEDTLLTMARGISSGMKYLAKMRFVHRDLAARNVLVNENLVCKVADFGLTRELEESCQGEYVTQGGKIPIRWTAPEAYKHRRFTTASDVWSFGVVLWEIMSYAERPYGNWDNYMVMDQVNANYRLTPPTNCPKIVHQLMMECWKSDRSQRPAFSDIVEMLERWIKNPYLLKDYEYVTEKTRMVDRKSCIAKSIREYLQAIKMERYIDNFIDFGYTELYQIQHFKDNDLVNIGVPLVGHRNKIIKGINPRGTERERLLPTTV